MFSVAIKHMSSAGKILASRVMGAADGTIKPVRKHYGLAMSYRINEGNGSSATTVDTVFPGGKYDALGYTPAWAHHRFGGWYDSAATPTTAVPTGTSISPSDPVVYGRSDVYARWQLPATVNFDATSGGGQMPGGWTAPDYYIGQPYGVLPVPTKSGETFLGWFTSGGVRITEDTAVPSDGTTLTARYMAVNYTTTYTCTTTSSYRNTGIYIAMRYSSSSPVVVDWGDNSVDVVYGSISQLAHTYSTSATFTVKISDNISSLQMSSSNSTWYGTTSQNRYTLKTIASLDSKITNYPSYCFYYCSALTSVAVPSGMTTVNSYCFYYCSALQNVALPSSCTSIDNYAFQYSGLRTTAGFVLPSNLTSIGSWAFSSISNSYFTTLTIPGTVTTIGSAAFYYCYYLKNITFASGSGTLTLGSSAFAYCGYYSVMAMDMSARTVTSIPSSCFYYCRYLKDFVFPQGLTTIGNYAFYYCWSQSSAAGTLTVPEGVTSISSSYAFAYCYYLTEISLPSTLTSIGAYAFYYCQRLATIRSNRLTAPTVQSTTFGNSNTYYTGRSSYSAGTNRLYVLPGATGYDSSYWADPLCSSAKCGFTKATMTSAPASSYVRPGIIFLKDGTENSAFGTHDASLRTWTDLIGGNYNAQQLPAAAYFESNALAFNGGSGGDNNSTFGRIPQLFASDFTAHACFRNISTSPTGFYCVLFSVQLWGRTESGIVFQVGHNVEQVETRAAYSGTVVASIPTTFMEPDTDYSVHAVWHRSTKTYDIWFGSVKIGSATIPDEEYSSKGYDTSDAAICIQGYGTLGTTYRLYTQGVYARALTDDEIRTNYALDKVRFGMNVARDIYDKSGSLVAAWDGEWLSEWDVHNSSASGWKDLIGGSTTSFGGSSNISVGDNYVLLNLQQLQLSSVDFSSLTGRTVEIILADDSGRSDNRVYLEDNNNNSGFSLQSNCLNARFTCNVQGSHQKEYVGTYGESIKFYWAITQSSTTTKTYLNGTPCKQANLAFTSFSSIGLGLRVAAYQKVFMVRVHSRVLSDSEIADLYAYDRPRFGLP